MARKKKQTSEVEQGELQVPELASNDGVLTVADEVEELPVSPIRNLVRPMPVSEWDTLVTEMHDYTTTHRNMIEVSLSKSHAVAEKFVAYKKPVRNSGQTVSTIVLRDDIPTPEPEPEDHVNLDIFYRNSGVKRKR